MTTSLGKSLHQCGGLRGIALLTGGNRTAPDIPSRERPYVSWCSGHRASGRAPDLQTPLFRPGGVLMRPDDGGIDDQIFEVRIIGHRLEDPPPTPLTLHRLKRRNTLF